MARPRWFFALWPNAAARTALADACAGLALAGARPTHPRDLHLTLRFLGELDDTALANAEAAAGRVRAECVPVVLDHLGHFARSRVLWAGPSRPDPALTALADQLEAALCAAGLPPETRPFRPHVTLARKVCRGLDPGSSWPGPTWPGSIGWRATAFALAAGRPGEMPRYLRRRSWPLGPQAR
jgi:2'-5' RNA ligase